MRVFTTALRLGADTNRKSLIWCANCRKFDTLGKQGPGYFFLGENTHVPHTLIAADPVTIERLLAANREALLRDFHQRWKRSLIDTLRMDRSVLPLGV